MARSTQEESGQRGRQREGFNSPSWPAKCILFISDCIWLLGQSVSEEIPLGHFLLFEDTPVQSVASLTQRIFRNPWVNIAYSRLVYLLAALPTLSLPAEAKSAQDFLSCCSRQTQISSSSS